VKKCAALVFLVLILLSLDARAQGWMSQERGMSMTEWKDGQATVIYARRVTRAKMPTNSPRRSGIERVAEVVLVTIGKESWTWTSAMEFVVEVCAPKSHSDAAVSECKYFPKFTVIDDYRRKGRELLK